MQHVCSRHVSFGYLAKFLRDELVGEDLRSEKGGRWSNRRERELYDYESWIVVRENDNKSKK